MKHSLFIKFVVFFLTACSLVAAIAGCAGIVAIESAGLYVNSLDELQEQINAEGYTVEYQNGANQSGTKQSDAVKTHIAMTKNHAAIIKQLCELVPPEKKKESRLQALRDE